MHVSNTRRYMAEILPIRHKTLSIKSIKQAFCYLTLYIILKITIPYFFKNKGFNNLTIIITCICTDSSIINTQHFCHLQLSRNCESFIQHQSPIIRHHISIKHCQELLTNVICSGGNKLSNSKCSNKGIPNYLPIQFKRPYNYI